MTTAAETGKSVTILVVDDDPDLAQGTALALRRAGYTVTTAGGGEEALATIRATRPPIVLVDREMQGINGLEVCRQVKADPALRDLLVVVISETHAESERHVEGLAAGADGFIDRPIANVELVARIEAFSRMALLTRRLREEKERAEAALRSLNNRRVAELNLLEDAVAERKKAQAALKALEESDLIFDHLMEYSPIYVFFKDENGRPLRLSRNFEKLTGKPLAEQLGKTMDELFPSELARKMVADDKRVLEEGRTVTVEEELNGRIYSTTKFPIVVEGKPRYLAGYTIDITEQSAAARKLADSEALYRTLVSAMGDGLTLQDENAAIVEFNAAAQRILGLTADQMRGKTSFDPRWRAIHEDGSPFPGDTHPVPVALRTGLPQTDVMMGIRKPDESLTWVSVNAQPLFRLGETKPYRVVATMHDVTERKRAEEQVRASERRFKETLDQLLEGCLILDFNWMCLYANNALARHGRQRRENLIGRKWTEIYPGIESTEVFKYYAEVMSERRPLKVQVSFTFPSGEVGWFEIGITPVSQGIFVMTHEITEAKDIEMRDSALLALEREAGSMEEKAFLQQGLDTLERLTRSKIGFLHFVSEDQQEISLITWTTDTMANYCTASYDSHYPVSAAGVWADAIRERRPIIVNDYDAYPDKKGLPEGHSHLQRFVSVPVLDQGLVRMILGVGNAPIPYGEPAVKMISQFAREMYRLVQRRRADAALQEREADLVRAEEKFRGIVEMSMVGVFMLDGETVTYANPRAAEILGRSAGLLEGAPLSSLVLEEDRKTVMQAVERLVRGESESARIEYRLLPRNGETVVVGSEIKRAVVGDKPVLFGVSQDVTERVRSQTREREYVARLERAMTGTVQAVSGMMDMRDPYTAGHERRVGELAAAIAAEMGMDEDFQQGLKIAGAVHDVGKIMVPAEILSKPGKLSPMERELIRLHPAQGYEVLKNIEFPWPVAKVALQHHERFDGSGYPGGLKGEDIIIEARIVAVADVVEAIGSHRPYRPSHGIDKALEEIERGRGTAYDARVADACLRLFRDKGYTLPA